MHPRRFKLAENYLSNLSSYFACKTLMIKKLENDYCGLNEFTDLKPSLLTNDIPLGRITSSFSQRLKVIIQKKITMNQKFKKKLFLLKKDWGPIDFQQVHKRETFFMKSSELIDYQKELDHSLLEKNLK